MAYDASKSKFAASLRNYGSGKVARRQIVYGPSGAGKTTYAGSSPKPLFLDVEFGENEKLAEGKYPFFPLAMTNTYEQVVGILKTWISGTDLFDKDGGPLADRQSCVIDSWTKLNKLLLKQAAAKAGRDTTMVRPTFEDYRILGSQQEEIIALLTDLSIKRGINIIITALPRVEGDEGEDLKRDANDDTGYRNIVGMPALIGAYRKAIGAEFQDLYYLEYVQGATPVRRLWTVPHDSYLAKTRLGLPASIINPTFDSVQALAKC